MIATPTVKDHEVYSAGLVEAAGVNSLTDFNPSKLNENEIITDNEKNDFIDIFICHLIFYSVFCVSLFLHIVIDLGFGAGFKKLYIQLIESVKKNFIKKKTAFS